MMDIYDLLVFGIPNDSVCANCCFLVNALALSILNALRLRFDSFFLMLFVLGADFGCACLINTSLTLTSNALTPLGLQLLMLLSSRTIEASLSFIATLDWLGHLCCC